MAFAPRPPPVEVVALSSARGDSETVRRSLDDPRDFRQRARREHGRRKLSPPRSGRPEHSLPVNDASRRSHHTLRTRPSSVGAGRYSLRSPNGQNSLDRARRANPSGFWGDPPSPDSADPRKARSLESQRRDAQTLMQKPDLDRLTALHKPIRSLRDQLFVSPKSKPDDNMLQPNAIQHSSWKGHDDPFSILTTEERLRQKLARKMRAASYTIGGQDWFTLFSRYDSDHSGGLDFREFSRAVRRDAAIEPNTVNDGELKEVFEYIDVNHDGLIDADELHTFMTAELSKDQDGNAKQQGAKAARIQKFLAESIALERIVMRAKADMHSDRVGVLPKGEIVAVTHVSGNRMHVRRLRWTADFEQREESLDSGWVSERADGGSGRLLMEVLPRDEWTSRNYNEKALADRVHQLSHMRKMAASYTVPGMLGSMQRQLQAQARELEREQARAKHPKVEKLIGMDERPLGTVKSTPGGPCEVDTEVDGGRNHTIEGLVPTTVNARASAGTDTVDKAAMVAVKILERCKEPAEVSALLQILETEPRHHWATLLARR